MKDSRKKIACEGKEDHAILEELRQGHEQAFDCIFDLFYNSLYNYIHHLVKDDAQTKDLLAEAFIRFWNERAKLTAQSLKQVKQFLFSVARNLCFDEHYKKNREVKFRMAYAYLRDRDTEEFRKYGLEDRREIEDEILTFLRKTFQKIPARSFEVLELYFFKSMTLKQIADQLNVSVDTVKSRKRYAVTLIKQYLREDPNLSELYFD